MMKAMDIIIPVGISGSGKSKLYAEEYPDLVLVSPDEVRKTVFGDVSDQEHNSEVFGIIDNMVNLLVDQKKSFYYDATNVNPRLRKKFTDRFRGMPDVRITYVVVNGDPETSKRRIKSDLESGRDRSNVPDHAVERQFKMFRESVDSGFRGENVQNIIYRGFENK